MRSLINAFVLAACLFLPMNGIADESAKDFGFQLYDTNDRLISLNKVLEEPGTKMVIVDFFSMACAPCKRSMPRLAELASKLHPKGLRVVIVAVPAGEEKGADLERIKRFFEPLNVSFPIVFDKYSVVAKKYGVTENGSAKLPQSFVIDAKGSLQGRFTDMDSLVKFVDE